MGSDSYFKHGSYKTGSRRVCSVDWWAFKEFNQIPDEVEPKNGRKVRCPICKEEVCFESSMLDEY